MIVLSISREFADGTVEPWSWAAAGYWRAYVLDMLGHGRRLGPRTSAVRLRTLHGLLVIRPRRLAHA